MSTSPAAFTLHTSFSPLVPLYEKFLLDQFGVIHNGSQSLHGAVDCIRLMLRNDKELAILSNTSSPSHVALKRLKKYGLREDMFAGGLVSSGEECAKFVRENYCRNRDENDGGKIPKALWFTWREGEKQQPLEFLSYCERGVGFDDGISIDIAESVDEADFILLHGSEVWRRHREVPKSDTDGLIEDLRFLYDEDYSAVDKLLEEAAARSLPCVCANPDLVVGLPGGVRGNMPGKIAQRYEKLGGEVRQFGKPNPRHYHACLENLGLELDANAKSIPGVAHVGDSLEHDVVGANAAGIDSIFVLGGIHAREIGLLPTGVENGGTAIIDADDDRPENGCITKVELATRLTAFFEEKGVWPTHVVPSLSLE